MKKLVLLALLSLWMVTIPVQAQQTVRIAYVDMEYILENIPEYQEASAQLDTKVEKWKTEVEIELQKLSDLKKELENEKPLLTPELIEQREEEIDFQEEKIRDYQQKRFGPKGDLMQQKMQLVQPIQDQVFIAVQEIAKNRNYDLILDKSADVVMLYASDKLDVSDMVLRSINRASKREQLHTRKEKDELIREESKSVEESEAVSKRETAKEERQRERREYIEAKRQQRDSLRAAKKEEYEARHNKSLEERQQKKDSVQQARKEDNNKQKAF